MNTQTKNKVSLEYRRLKGRGAILQIDLDKYGVIQLRIPNANQFESAIGLQESYDEALLVNMKGEVCN